MRWPDSEPEAKQTGGHGVWLGSLLHAKAQKAWVLPTSKAQGLERHDRGLFWWPSLFLCGRRAVVPRHSLFKDSTFTGHF